MADETYQPLESEESSEESHSENEADETEQTEAPKSRGKKRKSNPKIWQKNVHKKKVTGGLERKTKCGTVNAKQVGLPCKDTCHLRCSTKVSEEHRQAIHSMFWNPDKSMDLKRQFVASMVECVPIMRIRPANGKRTAKRPFTRHYFFDVNNIRVNVCQKFFLSTLSISETFVTTAIRKKSDGGIVEDDQRGKHIPVNKISEFVKQGVRDHIKKFPVVESHYTRERSDRKYLGNELNINRMYELYRTDCHENNVPEENIAKSWLYSTIFNTEFNYSFKLPYNDTCDECDKFLLAKTQSTENREDIDRSYQEHLDKAGKRYALKRTDKETAIQSDGKIKFVTVDLQKCLPTPLLTNQQSFYKLKLWTYNYTISDAAGNVTSCIMWDESKSGRGANEMASGILKWAKTLSESVQEITIWSDNCPSQNRNMIMVMAYFWILKNYPNIKKIDHKFLLRGHTHMEVDGDHSLIERERKRTPFLKVMTPWDWQQLARLCCRSKTFNVVNMEVSDFKDFKSLYTSNSSPFVVRKKTEENEDFRMSGVVHLQARSENIGVLYFKSDFEAITFECVDLKRNGRRVVFPELLPQIREQANEISTKKYNHLQSLLPWIPSIFHDFYKNLAHSDKATDDV